jgi:hypothetical protein
MSPGRLRVVALYVSGMFVVFYVVCMAQFLWVCEENIALGPAGYVPLLESPSVFCSRCYEPSSRRIPLCTIKVQVAILQFISQSFLRFSSFHLAQSYISGNDSRRLTHLPPSSNSSRAEEPASSSSSTTIHIRRIRTCDMRLRRLQCSQLESSDIWVSYSG